MTALEQSDSDSDPIRFILDGEVKTVRGVDPNTTVLNYLRETLRRTGTKEGCAEGDCGACTVVLGEIDRERGDRVRLRAINSCIQFVPTLDGKELFTVESLKAPDGTLHPAQEAMVECHGSQCGFCTPGFIMSLFAMYKSEPEQTDQGQRQADLDVVDEAISAGPHDENVGGMCHRAHEARRGRKRNCHHQGVGRHIRRFLADHP